MTLTRDPLTDAENDRLCAVLLVNPYGKLGGLALTDLAGSADPKDPRRKRFTKAKDNATNNVLSQEAERVLQKGLVKYERARWLKPAVAAFALKYTEKCLKKNILCIFSEKDVTSRLDASFPFTGVRRLRPQKPTAYIQRNYPWFRLLREREQHTLLTIGMDSLFTIGMDLAESTRFDA